jgi:hypothetical protein
VDGPEGAQDLLEGYLAAAFPAALDAQAARLEIVNRTVAPPRGWAPLPNPKIMPPAEVAKLAEADFPCLIVTIWDVVSVERTDPSVIADLDDPNDLPEGLVDGPQYRVTYTCRVFSFARGKDYADTQRTRFRYALALRETLLGRPSLGEVGAGVDESSWRESYSELDRTAARTIGATYAEFRLTRAEELSTATVGDWVADVLEVYRAHHARHHAHHRPRRRIAWARMAPTYVVAYNPGDGPIVADSAQAAPSAGGRMGGRPARRSPRRRRQPRQPRSRHQESRSTPPATTPSRAARQVAAAGTGAPADGKASTSITVRDVGRAELRPPASASELDKRRP